MNINLTPLLKSIFDYDPDGPNIHHLMAVHGYSRLIAQMENVDGHTLFITEVAAYLHDIGVKVSKEKYGNSQPQHQEAEGPAIARKLLEPLSLPAPDVERICFIIGHHHTYKAIDGLDFQILVEADFIDFPKSQLHFIASLHYRFLYKFNFSFRRKPTLSERNVTG